MNNMDKKMKIASEEHQKEAMTRFEEKFDEMVNLMADARKVEIRLRIYYEVIEHIDKMRTQDYLKYKVSNFTVNRSKFNRILKRIALKEDNDRFQLIREILDPLAHSDYLKAREKIEEYTSKYDSTHSFSSALYPERRMENVTDAKGKPCNYNYLLESSNENLIPEEYLVFKHQGYVDYARALIDEILSSFKSNNKIGWLYEILSISRTTKRGQIEYL